MKPDPRIDRVDLHGGIVHLPAEFREVARLANKAGLEGWQFVDAEIGVDLDAMLQPRTETDVELDDFLARGMSRVKISYEKTSRINVWDALERLIGLQAHYARLLNQYDGGQRRAFETAQQWIARLEELKTPASAEGDGLAGVRSVTESPASGQDGSITLTGKED